MLRIGRIHVESFMRLKAFDCAPNGHHVLISGPNGSGKTTIVDAVWSALSSKGKDIPEPIHAGDTHATVRLDLTDGDGNLKFIVERHWTPKSMRLSVRAPDGSEFKRKQELLDSFLDTYTLNPVQFLRLRPQDQVEEILKAAGVRPPEDQVETILGEPFPAQPSETVSSYFERIAADDRGVLYIRRMELGRVAKQKAAAVLEARQMFDALAMDDGILPPSTAELAEQLKLLNGQKNDWQEAHDCARNERGLAREGAAKLGTLETQVGRLRNDEKSIQQQIDMLLAKQAGVRKEISELEPRIEKGKPIVRELEARAAAAELAAERMPEPSAAIADCLKQMSQSEALQAKIAKRSQTEELLKRLAEEQEFADAAHARMDLALSRIRELRGNLLEGTDLGIPGLSIGNGEPRLNGVSFKQASQAQKVVVAGTLAFRRNPELKILRLDEAECLDANSLSILQDLADKHGFQCLLTFVRDTDDLAVEIVEAQDENVLAKAN